MTELRTRPLLRVIEGTGGSNSAPSRVTTSGQSHRMQLVRVESDKATNRRGPSSPNRYPGGDAA